MRRALIRIKWRTGGDMYVLLISGIGLLSTIMVLFWLKDRLHSPALARFAHSNLIARLALAGAAFSILGLLMIVGEFVGG